MAEVCHQRNRQRRISLRLGRQSISKTLMERAQGDKIPDLRALTATRAATVQLAVPVLAAAAGVVLLGGEPSLRLALSALLILGGLGLSLIRAWPGGVSGPPRP